MPVKPVTVKLPVDLEELARCVCIVQRRTFSDLFTKAIEREVEREMSDNALLAKAVKDVRSFRKGRQE